MTAPNVVDGDIEWALADIAARAKSYQTARDYVAGRQKLQFASERFLSAFGGLFGASPTNMMPIAIDAVADRLVVSGFDSPDVDNDDDGTPDPEDTVSGKAWDLWETNRMDTGGGQVHQEALTCGDAFVLAWPDQTNTVRYWQQDAEQIAVRYDEAQWNTIDLTAKCWLPLMPDPVTRKRRWRLTLYYPTMTLRFITRDGRSSDTMPTKATEFIPYTGDQHGPTEANQFGMPCFHFNNNGRPGSYGRSELNDLIPIQDKFNKTTADMLVAMEFASFPQRWAVGFEPEIDDLTGKPRADALKPGVDRFLTFASEVVKVGQFATADLNQFLSVLTAFREEVAIIAGLPLHYVMPIGRYPSGEAIKMAEGRLVAKVNDRQIAFGQTWADLSAFALKVQGGVGTGLEDGLKTMWVSSETRNDLLEAQVQLVKQQLGVSQEQSLTEMGYSAQEIEDMLDEEAEKQRAMAQMAAALAPPPPGAIPPASTTLPPVTATKPDPSVPIVTNG